ncbi:Hypothetical protein I595_1953 [Croceitalea dokdonensis DOKDO 023]|uniref:Uncharacterized protein n=1 Tax=Croceitalea dokdonensis DOKDO 023 TaxID=1300341 RepID=A0A0P7AW92_9FLAO|nr:Hypothetical protein I595_1953 [Croceitalea dokdonensis DOKDO 023]
MSIKNRQFECFWAFQIISRIGFGKSVLDTKSQRDFTRTDIKTIF